MGLFKEGDKLKLRHNYGGFGVQWKHFGYNAPDNCKKYVEFSDCFTED